MVRRGSREGRAVEHPPVLVRNRLATQPAPHYAEPVRRNAILVTLLGSTLGVCLLSLALHVWVRPPIVKAFADYGTEMPQSTAVALSSWFLPGAMGLAVTAGGIAALIPLSRAMRVRFATTGLLVVSFAAIFATWAAFAPLFQPG